MIPATTLVIAGSDSGGGAGIQADIKTIAALGGHASTAITALTAQNTVEVESVFEVPPRFVTQQIQAVMCDIGAQSFKTGMLHNVPVIEAVADELDKYPEVPLIVDPVMVATSGSKLMKDSLTIFFLKKRLISKSYIVTPNIPEAEILAEMEITNLNDMEQAALKILQIGAKSVLIKGGHLQGEVVFDLLLTENGVKEVFEHSRIDSNNTHGTGCTLASAIACCVAKGMSLTDSIITARNYVYNAILNSYDIGEGGGPVGLGVAISSTETVISESYTV